METNYKTLQIQIPNGYEIDKSKSTFENIVFKKKDRKLKSWKEYCNLQIKNGALGYFIDNYATVSAVNWENCCYPHRDKWKSVLPNKEYAEAFLALMQLVSLRKAWVGDWESDFNDNASKKWLIQYGGNKFIIVTTTYLSSSLSFPTKEMAEDFLECFKDLLEQAKILL